MKKDVVIYLKAITFVDGDKDETELTTVGKLFYKDSKYYLVYKESEITGMEGTTTIIEVDKEKQINLKRRGTQRNQLIIESGKRHLCQYETDYGDLLFGISSRFIKNNLSMSGGNISFGYTIDVNSSVTTINEIHIKVKEC